MVRGIDLVRTEWLEALGGGLHELLVRHDAAEISQMFGGPDADEIANAIDLPRSALLRVFVHLSGRSHPPAAAYDKGKDPSEKCREQEFARAPRNLTAWNEEQERGRRRREGELLAGGPGDGTAGGRDRLLGA